MWREKINRELYFFWSTLPIFSSDCESEWKNVRVSMEGFIFFTLLEYVAFSLLKIWRTMHLPNFSLQFWREKNNLTTEEKKIRFYFVQHFCCKNHIVCFRILLLKQLERFAFTKRSWTYHYHLPQSSITSPRNPFLNYILKTFEAYS